MFVVTRRLFHARDCPQIVAPLHARVQCSSCMRFDSKSERLLLVVSIGILCVNLPIQPTMSILEGLLINVARLSLSSYDKNVIALQAVLVSAISRKRRSFGRKSKKHKHLSM